MSETMTARIASILQKIEAIEYISQNAGSITQALDEEKDGKTGDAYAPHSNSRTTGQNIKNG